METSVSLPRPCCHGPTTGAMRVTFDRQHRWRHGLLAKGAEVAQKLDGNMSDEAEDRARRFLEHIDRCIKRCGKPAFGRCIVCNEPLPPSAR